MIDGPRSRANTSGVPLLVARTISAADAETFAAKAGALLWSLKFKETDYGGVEVFRNALSLPQLPIPCRSLAIRGINGFDPAAAASLRRNDDPILPAVGLGIGAVRRRKQQVAAIMRKSSAPLVLDVDMQAVRRPQ